MTVLMLSGCCWRPPGPGNPRASADAELLREEPPLHEPGDRVHLLKKHGGLERSRHVGPRSRLHEGEVHVRSCDVCHRLEVDGKGLVLGGAGAGLRRVRAVPPGREDDADVHFKRGMRCMDCHTARDVARRRRVRDT